MLSYSWVYRDNGTDILYANGSTISISLRNMSLGAEFFCLVQNPAHRNIVSVLLKSLGGRQTEVQKEIQTEIQPKVQTEIPPGIHTEIRSEIQTEIRSKIKTGLQREIQPEMQTELHSGIRTEVQTEIQTELQPKIKAEIRPEIRTKLQPEIQTDIQTELRPNIKTEIQPKIQKEIRPWIQTELQPDIRTEIQTDIKPNIQTKAKIKAGGDIQVIGRAGETVTLQCPLNLPTRISWMYDDNGDKVLLAEYRHKKFIRGNNNYFMNRLEGSNSGSGLRIKEVKMEDSGVFTAHITVNGSVIDISYILTVLGRGDIIVQVTGRLGETVTLPTSLNLATSIERITWIFHDKGKKIHLAEFRHHKFIRGNKNYFNNRLEKTNHGTALQIRELRMEDSGIFTAHIHINGKKNDISYILAVFEPIPTPVIDVTSDDISIHVRHLHCSVPSNSTKLSYSWIYRDNGTDVLYANGSTTSVSLKNMTSGAEFICLVQNPAYMSNVSVLLKSHGGRRTEIQKEIEPEINLKMQPARIQTEIRPEIQTEIRPGIQTEMRPEIQTDMPATIHTVIRPGMQTEMPPIIQTEIQPAIQTKMPPKIQTEIHPEIQTDLQTGIQTERYNQGFKQRYNQGLKQRYNQGFKQRYNQRC
ncbi:uncharacterized protein LOC121397341 [Xenopus laevis]|uniref:Uncharacterized protein LOC121397341 n=1 Tax=Xenopus laevis TaxID=8355 RepID=A0A8J1LKV6_XENLA|nr:uncharacterized protein LOC121397341 [Xenopus laevis]